MGSEWSKYVSNCEQTEMLPFLKNIQFLFQKYSLFKSAKQTAKQTNRLTKYLYR